MECCEDSLVRRRSKGLAVIRDDRPGTVGAFLNGHLKPRTIAGEPSALLTLRAQWCIPLRRQQAGRLVPVFAFSANSGETKGRAKTATNAIVRRPRDAFIEALVLQLRKYRVKFAGTILSPTFNSAREASLYRVAPFDRSFTAFQGGVAGANGVVRAHRKTRLPADVPELLGHEFGAGEIGIRKADDEELVGVCDLISIRVGDSFQEVVIVGDPESMKS
jgi:hypothetical protein